MLCDLPRLLSPGLKKKSQNDSFEIKIKITPQAVLFMECRKPGGIFMCSFRFHRQLLPLPRMTRMLPNR